jgi:hypothetical protein
VFQLLATGIVDTVGKLAIGVVDTVGKLPPMSLTPAASLLAVSMTPSVFVADLPPVSLMHLDLQISPRIFKKI